MASTFVGSDHYRHSVSGITTTPTCKRHWTGSAETIKKQFENHFSSIIADELRRKEDRAFFGNLLTIGALGLVGGVAMMAACPLTAGATCIIAAGAISASASGTSLSIYAANEILNVEIDDARLYQDNWKTILDDIKAKNPNYKAQLNLINGDDLLTLNDIIIKVLNK
ncbi:MAG: hypothetical protein KBD78_13980 [Oligoflexales bacterium]|nr:hypothetical protein [Oligoflexales bacterium]